MRPVAARRRSLTATGSNGAMPIGNLPGWTQVLAEDFTKPVELGGFVAQNPSGVLLSSGLTGYNQYGPGRANGNEMRLYPDNWSTTHGTGLYAPNQTVSVQTGIPGANGVLDVYHHWGTPLNGSRAGALSAAAWFPIPYYSSAFNIGPYARAQFRMCIKGVNKLDPTNYHAVPLFIGPVWPDQGEFDFPEGDIAPNAKINGWHHHATAANTQERITGDGRVWGDGVWHIFTVEWTPGRVKYYMGNNLVHDTTNQVSSVPMAFVLQFETTTTAPLPTTEGHIQVDWLTIYAYTP